MSFSKSSYDVETIKIPVELVDKNIIWVEVAQIGAQNVAFDTLPFSSVINSIQTIAKSIGETLVKVGPSKASVKYGIEIGIEQGGLIATLVRGSGKANLEITLEWENPKPIPEIKAGTES